MDMQRFMASDLEIARAAQLQPIETIAWKLGIPSGELIPHGQYMAKLTWDGMKQRFGSSKGNLILVTSVNPTPFGEGKTVTTIGLTQALCHIGKNATCVIREPSMGQSLESREVLPVEVNHRFFQWKKSIYTLLVTFTLLRLLTISFLLLSTIISNMVMLARLIQIECFGHALLI